MTSRPAPTVLAVRAPVTVCAGLFSRQTCGRPHKQPLRLCPAALCHQAGWFPRKHSAPSHRQVPGRACAAGGRPRRPDRAGCGRGLGRGYRTGGDRWAPRCFTRSSADELSTGEPHGALLSWAPGAVPRAAPARAPSRDGRGHAESARHLVARRWHCAHPPASTPFAEFNS